MTWRQKNQNPKQNKKTHPKPLEKITETKSWFFLKDKKYIDKI